MLIQTLIIGILLSAPLTGLKIWLKLPENILCVKKIKIVEFGAIVLLFFGVINETDVLFVHHKKLVSVVSIEKMCKFDLSILGMCLVIGTNAVKFGINFCLLSELVAFVCLFCVCLTVTKFRCRYFCVRTKASLL